ncbi:MAG TPA: hypothetical protein VEU28_06430, partial [Actinomycetota bacterium]|nr:hypothetical protein [Actinomycetota bacterium]
MSSAIKAPPTVDQRSPGPSVLARLVLAVVVAGVLTGVVGAWMISNSAGDALRAQIDRQNEAQAASLAQRLDDHVLTRVSTLQVVATRQNVVQLGTSTQNELSVVLKPLPEIERLMIFGRNGEPLAAASSRSLVDLEKVGLRPGALDGLNADTF